MTADDIKRLLIDRHAKDVAVPECNMGSAWAGCRRIDLWALRRSWSPLTAIAYEVKVSRRDWLGDRKWTEYGRVCHELWVVAPAGVVQVEELPEGVGFLQVSSTGNKLLTKRKAQRHESDPEAFNQLLCYVVMSRSRIVADMWEANGRRGASRAERTEVWRCWAEEKRNARDVGVRVRGRVRETILEQERRAEELAAENSALRYLREHLDILGLGEPSKLQRYVLESALRRQVNGTTPEVQQTLQAARALVQRLEGLSAAAPPEVS